MFTELNKQELTEIDGGIPAVLGILAAAGIVAGTAIVTAGTVVVVGKIAQEFSDWIG